MIKKAASFILLLAVLVSSTGITLRKHTCRKMAVSRTYLINSPLKCCAAKAKARCHHEESAEEKDCCHFTAEYKFLDTEKRVNPEFQLNIPGFFTPIFQESGLALFQRFQNEPGSEKESPHPRSSFEILIDFGVLRV